MKISDYVAMFGNMAFITDSFKNDGYAPINTEVFQKNLVNLINFNFGNLEIRELVSANTIADRAVMLYAVNEYKYKHLYETTVVDYNPIENYNMVEGGTDSTTTSATTNATTGEQHNSSNNTLNRNTGAQNNENNSTNTKNGKENVTHKVTAYNSNEFENQSQDSTDFLGYEEKNVSTSKIGARIDTDTENSTETIGSRVDSSSSSESTSLDHRLTRTGNIGVTTTQQMLESEREVALFNFTLVVAKDILGAICYMVYSKEV